MEHLKERQRAGRLHPEVRERPPGGGSTAGRALDQAALEQVGLVHVLDRVLLLADRDGERRQPDRAPAELLADRAQDLAVETVESLVVDAEQVERLDRDVAVTTPLPRTSA